MEFNQILKILVAIGMIFCIFWMIYLYSLSQQRVAALDKKLKEVMGELGKIQAEALRIQDNLAAEGTKTYASLQEKVARISQLKAEREDAQAKIALLRETLLEHTAHLLNWLPKREIADHCVGIANSVRSAKLEHEILSHLTPPGAYVLLRGIVKGHQEAGLDWPREHELALANMVMQPLIGDQATPSQVELLLMAGGRQNVYHLLEQINPRGC